LSTFFRGAVLRERPDGLEVAVADAALERLEQQGLARQVERAFAAVVGAHISIHFIALTGPGTQMPGDAHVDRISPDHVRQGRMLDLLEREPALKGAVEALDLELLD
jgi:hypothetical protein